MERDYTKYIAERQESTKKKDNTQYYKYNKPKKSQGNKCLFDVGKYLGLNK